MMPLNKKFLLLLVVTFALAACGRKGPVRPLHGSAPDNSVYSTANPPQDCCN